MNSELFYFSFSKEPINMTTYLHNYKVIETRLILSETTLLRQKLLLKEFLTKLYGWLFS